MSYEALSTADFQAKIAWAKKVLEMRDIHLLSVNVEKDFLVINVYGDKSYKQLIQNYNKSALLELFETMVFAMLNKAGNFALKCDVMSVIYRTMRDEMRVMAFFPEVPIAQDYIAGFSLEHGFEAVLLTTYQSKTKKCSEAECKQLKHILSDVLYADTTLETKVVLKPEVLQASWDYFAKVNTDYIIGAEV